VKEAVRTCQFGGFFVSAATFFRFSTGGVCSPPGERKEKISIWHPLMRIGFVGRAEEIVTPFSRPLTVGFAVMPRTLKAEIDSQASGMKV
jgi:hypothetical protein